MELLIAFACGIVAGMDLGRIMFQGGRFSGPGGSHTGRFIWEKKAKQPESPGTGGEETDVTSALLTQYENMLKYSGDEKGQKL